MTNNLPQKLTSFVGRERQIAEVQRLLTLGRLLTLTGPGGCGKTRLAIQVASQLDGAFPDGVRFVALAPISDPDLVIATLAHALQVMESGSQSLLESVRNYLRDRQMLLVFDNFEQVATAASHLVDLLKTCPHITAVVTSRAALRVNGEREFAAPPLDLPDLARAAMDSNLTQYESVRLFIQRALAVKSDFAVTKENAPSIAEICVRLDGLPLAIELAAARIKILPPQAMLARLAEGGKLRLLTGGPRDLPSRQQTLRNTIEWSHDLLDEGEKALFRSLSVFVGGWTLEAAETICQGSGIGDQGSGVSSRSLIPTGVDLLDVVSSLVDKSLIKLDEREGGEPRFVMLETIREYAVERLEDSGEAAPMRALHAQYYLALAKQAAPELRGPNQVGWLDRLEREHDNLRAALSGCLRRGDVETEAQLAADLCWFWFAHGHLSEGRRWVDAVMEHGNAVPTLLRARLLIGAGRIANNQALYAKARSLSEEGLALFRELGDEQGIAASLNILGTVAIYSGEYERAQAFYEESLQLFRGLADKVGITKCLANLGTVAFYSGDYARARGFYEESLVLQRELGDMWGIAASLVNLGDTALNQRDYQEAVVRYKESFPLLNELGDKASIAECLEGLAASIGAWKGGQPVRAAQLFGAADALREMVGAPLSAASRPEYERNLKTARSLIHEVAFAEAWALGRTMTLEQALALVTEEVAPPAYPTDELTNREIDVLRLVASGLTNDQVAARLSLSSHTVHTHLSSIYNKLGLRTRSAATRYAFEHNLA